MYQRIGINLSKNLDNATKRIKVPAITQRYYYKDFDTCECEEELINFYTSDNNCDIDYDDSINYLDDDYGDCECSCEESGNESLINKIKCVDSKVAITAGVGALIGFIGLYKILKRR